MLTPGAKARVFEKFSGGPSASPDAVHQLQDKLGVRLPDDYALFLQEEADGGEGVIGSTYIILWRVEQVLELNAAYHVSEFAPGLVLFGSNGGGEAFGFD